MTRATVMVDWRLIGSHAWLATTRRLGKSLATAIGVALGIAVFLVTVGWSQTAGSQINLTFDRLSATELQIRDTKAETATDAAMPDDFEQRIARIPGVVAGGRLWETGTVDAASSSASSTVRLPMLVTDPGVFSASGATLASGRLPDAGTLSTHAAVAVLGSSAAKALHIGRVVPGVAVQLGSTRVMVIGILDSPGQMTALDGAVLVPPTAPVAPGDEPPPPAQMSAVVRVELGATTQVANALPLALRPQDPSRLGVVVPPEPAALRGDVQTSLNVLAFGAAMLSLLIGAVGIMNAMLTAVAQRSGEIGLRRALGGSRRHIVAQFLAEGALLGLLGAVLGAVTGEVALVVLAGVNNWTPVLARSLIGLAPMAGIIIGVTAALYPALRAASVEPATTLRT